MRRNGIAVGQAPAHIPQPTQSAGSTKGSSAKGRPSLRSPMRIAAKGQSATQRRQPLQLSRLTVATGSFFSGGSHGNAINTKLPPTRMIQADEGETFSISGKTQRKNQSSLTGVGTWARSAGPWLAAGTASERTSSINAVPTASPRAG